MPKNRDLSAVDDTQIRYFRDNFCCTGKIYKFRGLILYPDCSLNWGNYPSSWSSSNRSWAAPWMRVMGGTQRGKLGK